MVVIYGFFFHVIYSIKFQSTWKFQNYASICSSIGQHPVRFSNLYSFVKGCPVCSFLKELLEHHYPEISCVGRYSQPDYTIFAFCVG